jgi:tetratricopeptide (TPR) repeat protein
MKRAITLITALILFAAPLASCSKPLTKMTASELLDLGEKYLLDMDYEQAVVYFNRLIEIEPRNQRGYTGLAEAYLALDEVDDAIDILREGFDELSDNKRFLRKLADIYEEIIDESPSTRDAYIGLADVYVALGRIDDAIAILEQGLEQLPNNTRLRAMLDELRPPEPLPTPTPSPPPTPTATPNATPTATPDVMPAPIPSTVPANGQMASGTIEIVDVTPKTAVPGVETAFSVTVRYTSANIGGCIIYAGANTSESQRYALYDEYVLPDISGTYTFSFICTPASWTDNAFGIYVNMSEYPHPDSWTPLDMDVYDLAAAPTPTPTPSAAESVQITYMGSSIHKDPSTGKDNFTIRVGETVILQVKTLPAETGIAPVWESSDEGVFMVNYTESEATVTGVGRGIATLTVTVGNATTECIIRGLE